MTAKKYLVLIIFWEMIHSCHKAINLQKQLPMEECRLLWTWKLKTEIEKFVVQMRKVFEDQLFNSFIILEGTWFTSARNWLGSKWPWTLFRFYIGVWRGRGEKGRGGCSFALYPFSLYFFFHKAGISSGFHVLFRNNERHLPTA